MRRYQQRRERNESPLSAAAILIFENEILRYQLSFQSSYFGDKSTPSMAELLVYEADFHL